MYEFMLEAKYYKKLQDNKVQCRLCNHFCALADGEVGVCHVRKNIKGKLYSLVYNHPVALNLDPIEKKPLFHFCPGSASFSLGTFGCNFRCKNCQNYEISQEAAVEEKVKRLPEITPEQIVQQALDTGAQSIAYTYVEPTIFAEYALDIMKLARKEGLKNIWVSNGFMSAEFLQDLLPLLDAINIDLKSFEDKFYREVAGGRLQPVLDNIKTVKQSSTHLEITTLVIPTLSDDLQMLQKIIDFVYTEAGPETPWHISRFSGAISWQLKHLPETDIKLLEKVYQEAKKRGLYYVYLGNVLDKDKENTYCSQCGALAIRRLGYQVERFDNNGRCSQCGADLNIRC